METMVRCKVNLLYIYIGLAAASLGGLVALSHDRWENWPKPSEQIAARVDPGDAQDLNAKPQASALAPAASDVAAPTNYKANDTLPHLGEQQKEVQAQVDEAQKKLTSLHAALAETTRLRDQRAEELQKLEAQSIEAQQKLVAARDQLASVQQTITDRSQELTAIGKQLEATPQEAKVSQEVETTSVPTLARTPSSRAGSSTGGSQVNIASTTGAINQPHAINPTTTLPTSQVKKTSKKKAKVTKRQIRKAKVRRIEAPVSSSVRRAPAGQAMSSALANPSPPAGLERRSGRAPKTQHLQQRRPGPGFQGAFLPSEKQDGLR